MPVYTYLAARSLPVYIPCSTLTAIVHILQLAQCQCIHTLQLAHCQRTYLAARLLPLYISCSSLTASVHVPCSSLIASVHTLHVNKKYTRRPHERSTVQFIGHVDLVSVLLHFHTESTIHFLGSIFSVHAVSSDQSRESCFANSPRHRTETGRKKRTERQTMWRIPSCG